MSCSKYLNCYHIVHANYVQHAHTPVHITYTWLSRRVSTPISFSDVWEPEKLFYSDSPFSFKQWELSRPARPVHTFLFLPAGYSHSVIGHKCWRKAFWKRWWLKAVFLSRKHWCKTTELRPFLALKAYYLSRLLFYTAHFYSHLLTFFILAFLVNWWIRTLKKIIAFRNAFRNWFHLC